MMLRKAIYIERIYTRRKKQKESRKGGHEKPEYGRLIRQKGEFLICPEAGQLKNMFLR